MRALLDLHHLGRRQTGNETWARSIASRLLATPGDDEYDVVVTDAAGDTAHDFPARTTSTVSGNSARRLVQDMPRLIRTLGSDVVLVQYSMPLTSVPCVVAVHDLSFEDPRAAQWLPLSTRLRYRATIRASVNRAAHVLALSQHTRADLIQHYDLAPDRVSVVYAAADPALVRLITTTPERRVHGQVLAVGNVLPRKNLLVVGRAVRALRDQGHPLTLAVIGSVPDEGRPVAAELERLLADAVSFSGYVTPAQLAVAYRTASVLAYPSLYEGFGIPLLEAMAANLPVVCSDASCLPEVAGDAALVVPAQDTEAWSVAIAEVLGLEATRARLSAAGRHRSGDFSWDDSAARVRDRLLDAAR